MNEKTKQALNKMLTLFESGDVPEALAIACLPSYDVPSAHWSICNRLLAFLNHTIDARGFRQWKMVGRWPKKGAKAIYIICPQVVKKENADGEKVQAIIGFRAAPVFRFEDTDGKELQVDHLPPKQLPPLIEVAEKWDINVSWKGLPSNIYGLFSPSRKVIELCTYDESVFFHELAHAAHHKTLGTGVQIALWRKEVVAELTAAVLALLCKKQCNTGAHYRYISDYAQKANQDAYHACMAVVTDVGQCLDLILAEKKEVLVAA
jgi:hypothetical protein